MACEDDVRDIALSLPETVEKLSYGTPGFRVRDPLFARIREERDVLVVWCADLGEKAFLVAAEPHKFLSDRQVACHYRSSGALCSPPARIR